MTEGPKVLPSFKGYTVDEKLRQFRKVDREQGIEFIPFDSEQGEVLLREWYQAAMQANDSARD